MGIAGIVTLGTGFTELRKNSSTLCQLHYKCITNNNYKMSTVKQNLLTYHLIAIITFPPYYVVEWIIYTLRTQSRGIWL